MLNQVDSIRAFLFSSVLGVLSIVHAAGPPLSTVPAYPKAAPVEVGTALYGTVSAGGASGCGAIWKYDEGSSSFSILYSFDGAHGAFPYSKLLSASDGYLYGTTNSGGGYATTPPVPVPAGNGTVFRIHPDGTGFQVVYVFPTSSVAASPTMGLIQDPVNDPLGRTVLYGTTPSGGANGDGTIYMLEVDSSGASQFTKLYDFPTVNSSTQNATGANPQCELILQTVGSARYLFGTTPRGGPGGFGTVWQLGWVGATSQPSSTTSSLSVLHSYASGPNTLMSPLAGLTLVSQPTGSALGGMVGTAGASYTNTFMGGGGVFSVVNGAYSSTELPITGFDINFNARGIQSNVLAQIGLEAEAPLFLASDGYLYGTTCYGGHQVMTPTPPYHPYVEQDGTIFRISGGAYQLVWVFEPEGNSGLSQNPVSGVVQASDGYLYGTTSGGTSALGIASNGAVYRFPLGTCGQVSLVHRF